MDAWRYLNPQSREYTWYSKRKNKATGKTEDFNGFRLDYIFASPVLQGLIADVAMLQEPRHAGTSDHASVVASFDLSTRVASPAVSEPETPPATPEGVGRADVGHVVCAPPPSAIRLPPNTSGRLSFELAPGDLPDMACGVNGRAFTQHLRPTRVTAELAEGVLKEIRIWGPRVLQDGSVGKRELDHVWKRPIAEGGVESADLPPVVAERLRAHIDGV